MDSFFKELSSFHGKLYLLSLLNVYKIHTNENLPAMKKLFSTALLLLLLSPVFCQVDFRKETIYFLITSRFFDGDSSNNAPNEWCSYFPGNPNNANFSGPKDVTWRGDFRGLIQKLDYIKDLGFTAIWITPIVQNRGPLD